MQVSRYPLNSDNSPMELQTLLMLNANGGGKLTSPPLGPDGAPIAAKAAVLLDASGAPFDPSNVVTPSSFGNYGKADDSDIVQAAINSGKVIYWDREYSIATPLTAGNGSNVANSTINGICAFGRTGGTGLDETAPRIQPTGLKWVGAAGATVLTVNGPAVGINFEHFHINCNNITGVNGIQCNHMMMSTWIDVTVSQYKGVAYVLEAYAARAGMVQGANKNTFIGVRAVEPGSGGSGIRIGVTSGFVNQMLDVAQNEFNNCMFLRDGLNVNTYAVNLCFTDNLTFIDTAIWDEGAAGSLVGNSCWISPPAGTGNHLLFPQSITMINSPVRTGFKIDGTWAPTKGIFLGPYPTGDGEPIPNSPYIFGFDYTGRRFGPNSLALPAAQLPANNGDMTFQLIDNTHVAVTVRGNDGLTRTNTLVLA